ncbi:hypothetical protein HAX54_014135, partial [Datura stramonium]|nr:hypothetical protein [Datura stramonium]
DELLSDSFPYKELENGILWEVQGKWVTQGAVDVDIGANPSAEGADEDEGVNDQAVKVVDIVDTFRLQEQPSFDKKQFVTFMKRYIKNLTPKLEGEAQDTFKKNIESATKFLMSKLKDLQFVIATVMELPSPSASGRLLLLLNSISEATETSNSKRAKRKSSYSVGSLVQAEITEIRPLELRLKFGSSFHGRVHITETSDDNCAEAPFSKFRFGQTLTARIISKFNMSESVKRGYQWELSIKPSTLAGSGEIEPIKKFSYSTGQLVSGFVYKVDNEWAWLTISRDVKAQLYILDSSSEPNELDEFQKRFSVGKAFSGYVLSCNKEKNLVRLVSHQLSVDPGKPACQGDDHTDQSIENMAFHICEGSVLGGRISKILPGVGGLLVQIDPHLYGKVHFTELTDPGVADPLSGYHEGQFVKCKVLEIAHSGKGTVHIDLSL